jgi:Rieske Fe-S protein
MSSKLGETITKVLAESCHDDNDVRAATAVHQNDFPYNRDEEAQVTRREFCNFLGLTSAALFVGATGFAANAALDARRTETFSPAKIQGAESLVPGTSLNFRYPTEKDTAILIRLLDGSYKAFGQKCTHLSCPVYFDRDHQRLECPCHEGGFDAKTGDVLHGPPPRPLDSVSLEIMSSGEVWAIGRVAGTAERSI